MLGEPTPPAVFTITHLDGESAYFWQHFRACIVVSSKFTHTADASDNQTREPAW